MKRIILFLFLLIGARAVGAQQVDSIFFHLYTDSLKKGTHNYISVDGKLSNGQWMPLTSKELQLSSSACQFSGNELVIPANFSEEKITVKAILRSNPSTWIERTIWIKRNPDPDNLPTRNDVMKPSKNNKRRK